jgi:hypothetical protein
LDAGVYFNIDLRAWKRAKKNAIADMWACLSLGSSGVMDIESARKVVAEGDAKYGAVFQQLCDWQYNAFQVLRDRGAISNEGFARIVAVPPGRNVPTGGKGGPWIGVRTLTDKEVIDTGAVAKYVLAEACQAKSLKKMVLLFDPFLAPCVVAALVTLRADLRQSFGWLGRMMIATPLGRRIHPRTYTTLSALAALLDAPRGGLDDIADS